MTLKGELTFPKAELNVKFDLMAQHRLMCTAGILNPYVPVSIQLLGDDMRLGSAADAGVLVDLFTRLVPPLVAERLDQLHSHQIDYKAYSINFADEEIQQVMFGETDAGAPAYAYSATRQRVQALQIVVEHWTSEMLRQYAEEQRPQHCVFRRSLIICFNTLFEGGDYPYRCQHAITLALETRTSDKLRLLIFDHQNNGYHYNVHEQLQSWMANMVDLLAPTFRFVTRELVCLEGHVHYNEFMRCMSAAYRVCLLLARIDDVTLIDETEDDFENTTNYLQAHVIRMLNWLDRRKDIASLRVTVVASPKMTQPFYELSNRDGGLFLYLMPYDFFKPQGPATVMPANAGFPAQQQPAAVKDKKRIFKELDAACTPRLRFDLAQGFMVCNR